MSQWANQPNPYGASTPASSSATSPLPSNLMSPPQLPVPAMSSEQVATPTSSTRAIPAISNNLPTDPLVSLQPPEGKARIFRSEVWDHFTPYWRGTKTYEKDLETQKVVETIVWKMRAKCKYCPKGTIGDFACESGPNGTGGLRKHVKQCKYYGGNIDLKKQKVLSEGTFNQLTTRGFNQKDIMEACVEMVVLDELPFSFVERKGFRKFCTVGMPLFKVPSRRTLVRTFLEMYEVRKMKLKEELKSHRICLTTDTWSSLQNYNYMVLTAHYIDSNWKMHKRVLNFCVITNHQGDTIADLLEQCLSEWGIDKVLAITVDNAAANGVALNLLRNKLNDCDNPQSILDGKHLHVRCVAHITNLIVEKGLEKLNPSILAVRNAVKYVRSSPARLESFKKYVAREKLPFKGLVCLDIPTRWNSSFLMLESALRLKKAFKRMETDASSSGPYLGYFNEPEELLDDYGNIIKKKKGKISKKAKKKKVGPPNDDDWDRCSVFVTFLRIFYEVTLRVSASIRPTIHTTLHDIVTIEQAMDNLTSLPHVQGVASTNQLMAEIGSLMKKKYNKYFGNFKKMNPFIILGLVLDPRFKLKYVDHLLRDVMQWLDFEVENKITEMRKMMIALYDEYVEKLEGDKHAKKRNRDENTTSNVRRQKTTRGDVIATTNKLVDEWGKRVSETNEAEVTHEIDRYLTDPLVPLSNKNDEDGINEDGVVGDYRMFDVLYWWKLASEKYPILGSIARDVFAIQVSTVASESAFSTGGRVIDAFRCSLTPTSVEALICMQNWLRGDDIVTQFDDEPCAEELEFYEGIETELANAKTESLSTVEG